MRSRPKAIRRYPKPANKLPRFEILEDRIPVSEQIGTAVAISTLSGLSAALVRGSGRQLEASSAAGSISGRQLVFGATATAAPSGVTAPDRLAVAPSETRPASDAGLRPTAPSRSAEAPVMDREPFDDLTQEFFDLVGSATPMTSRRPAPHGMVETEGHAPVGPADAGSGAPTGSAGAVPPSAGGLSAGIPVPFADYQGPAATFFEPPQAAFTAGSPGAPTSAPALEPASGSTDSAPTGGQGSGPLDSQGHHHHGRDPLWVLDANNALVLRDGGTYHDFSTYAVDLYAQVSGGAVLYYNWDLSGAPDAQNITGTSTYHLHFTWQSFVGMERTDTIIVAAPTGGGLNEQTLTFKVVGTDSPANYSPRPTTTSTWPAVQTPDLMTDRQATLNSQYYRLGLATGEVQTSHTLPAYNPAVAPLQLVYSSTAADRLPIFIAHYTFNGTASSVTAKLTLNSVDGPVSTYDTSTLNPNDIMEIPLQATAQQMNLSPGRYSYSITVTENGNSTTLPTGGGQVNITNSSTAIAGIFGSGWSLAGLERLYPQGTGGSNGAVLDLGGGLSLWFDTNHSGGFITPAGDSSTLAVNGTGYVRTLKDNTKINFDSSGRQTSMVDRHGNTLTYAYDGNGKLLSITDLHNQVVTFGYNASNEVNSITDPVTPTSRVTTLGYDASGRLSSITDPTPGGGAATPVTTMGYDSSGRMTTLRDPENHLTTFVFDSGSGRVRTVDRPDGNTDQLNPLQIQGLGIQGFTVSAVLAAQVLADYTDPRSNDWLTELDWLGFGQAVEASDPIVDGNGNHTDTTVTHRDANGLPWLGDDPLARRTRTFFDTKFNATERVLADDTVFTFTYDGIFNELTTVAEPNSTDPNGNITTYVLDTGNGNVLTIKHPQITPYPSNVPSIPICNFNWGGTNSTYLLNGCDENSNWTTFGYDSGERPTSIRFPGPSIPTVTLAYNTASVLNSFQDENTKTTTYTPDALERFTSVSFPANPGGTITYAYDAASNLTSITDAAPTPNVTTFNYDSMNRLHTVIDPAGSPNNYVSTYVYDPAGNLQDLYDRDGRHRQFGYDAANRLTTEQWLNGSTVLRTFTYSYDAASELTQVQDPDSKYAYTYDSRGRVTKVDNTGGSVPTMVLTYGYDATGNRTSLGDSLMTGTSTFAYSYDADNRLVNMNLEVNGKGALMTLSYDLGGRLRYVQRTATGGLTSVEVDSELGYNERDLVTTMTHSKAGSNFSSFTYVYDPARHLTSSISSLSEGTLTYTNDSIGELTAVSGGRTENYAYDANGNRTSANGHSYGTPGAGNRLLNDGVFTYGYDNEGNETTRTRISNGAVTTYTWDYRNRLTRVQGSVDVQFTYDAFDRRIGKLVGATQYWTAYTGYNPYGDFNGTTLTSRYLYGDAIDQIFARLNANPVTVIWYLADNVGSIRRFVDNAGAVQDTVTYGDSYGNSPSDSGTGDRFKFTGREYDSETGLYYYRARYYDPAIGRFISQDPINFSGRDANLYRYVTNRPVNSIDRIGLATDLITSGPTFPNITRYDPSRLGPDPGPKFPLPFPPYNQPPPIIDYGSPFQYPGILRDRPGTIEITGTPTSAEFKCGALRFFIEIGGLPDFGGKPNGPVTDVPPNDGYTNPKPFTIGPIPIPVPIRVGVEWRY
jgi:RHS repeat-associated protein